jgi:hypothetical protein
MERLNRSFGFVALFLFGLFLAALLGCSGKRGPSPEMQAKIDSMKTELAKYANNEIMMESYLAKFDTLDFVVFSNQEWVRLHESHSQDVLVNWPDGHQTSGLERHIEDLKALFVYAPDTNIKVHPIRFGTNGWTCVTGVMTGTFTKPMPIGGGKFIKPTGKSFSVPMCTVGHWKDGVMIEESLFWDNATYMKQIGLGK